MKTADHIATFVRQAGALLKKSADQKVCSFTKSDGTPTSEADLASQEILVKGFHQSFSDWPLLVEEGLAAEDLEKKFPGISLIVSRGDKENLPERYVSIDPADGTVFLLNNYPIYAVSAAMVECRSPAVSVLYMPGADLMVLAERGKGCVINGVDTSLAHDKLLRDSLIGLDNCGSVNSEFRCRVIDPIVSACLFPTNLPSVASGIDLLLGRTGAWISSNAYNWDIAGTSLAVREAGGECSHLVFSEDRWVTKPIEWNVVRMAPVLFAATHTIQEDILSTLNRHGR